MNKDSNANLALNAMHRASKQAVKRAARWNLSIPVWKDGNIIYVKAKDQLKKLYTA